MLTVLFIIFMLGFMFKGIDLAFRFSWGLLKALLTIVFWPLILIGFVIGGLVQLALPLLIVAGIIMLISSLSQGDTIAA